MVNENYEPTKEERRVLEVLNEEKRVNPLLVRQETGFSKGTVNTALSNLRAAGWVSRRCRGLYDLVEDPRQSEAADREETTEDETSSQSEEDMIGAALEGWTHGRGAKEQEASESVARDSLEWLRFRDEGASKSDVPLEQVADNDPHDRAENSLWEKVIRPAWNHAHENGYVEKPNSRSYVWVGDGDE